MKKVMCVVLMLAIFITSLNSIPASAATNEQLQEDSVSVLSLKKDNYNYLEGKPGDTHLVYTYDSNGSTFKVIENATENFEEVNSTIYKKESNGEFVEYATQNLTVNGSIFTHTTNINGEVTTEIQDLSVGNLNTLNEDNISFHNSDKDQALTATRSGTYNGYEVTGWQYGGTIQGSNKISNWTSSAVVALVTYLATAGKGHPVAYATAVVIGHIAEKIVDEQIPVIYYTQFYYELRLADPPLGLELFVVGSNWYTNYYEDSRRTDRINSTDEYKYADGYVE